MDPVPPNSAGAPFYRSITDAINAANPGDTVHVRPGKLRTAEAHSSASPSPFALRSDY